MSEKVKRVALCYGRHDIKDAVDGYIFPHNVNLDDLAEIEDIADKFACQCKLDGKSLHLYCTGVQPPLVSVINACHRRDVKCTVYHWNPKTESYYPQEVYD